MYKKELLSLCCAATPSFTKNWLNKGMAAKIPTKAKEEMHIIIQVL